ncbi:MAG: RNA methyltransferase [Chloroflexota bacterium]
MITARANALVKQARALKERRGREAAGLYPIEGVRLVEEALHTGVAPAMVLYHEPLLQMTERGSRLVERLRALACPGGAATLDVLREVCDTVHPAGVMAALPLPAERGQPALPAGRGLSIVLGEIQDPGNAGSILRTAAAAGLDGVIATPGTVDLFAPKVVRAGMGAHLRLALRTGRPWASLTPWLATQAHVVVADGRAERTIYDLDWTQRAVIVLGNEARGPEAVLGANARPFPMLHASIPMPGGSESLNVAAAAAILVYEALRQRREDEKRRGSTPR